MKHRRLAWLLSICLLSTSVLSTSVARGAQGEQIAVPKGTCAANFGYYEYLPLGYDDNPSAQWPVVVFWHGLGEKGDGTTQLGLVLKNGPPKLIKNGKHFSAVVISPQTGGWPSTASMTTFMNFVLQNYRVDTSRVYITGLSMGGKAAWVLAQANPDMIAATVPVCGASNPSGDVSPLANIPVWAFHNSGDTTVRVSCTYNWINAITAAGGSPLMTIYDAGGHDAWTRTYNDQVMWDWMFSQSKGSGPVNAAPVVSAGADQDVQLPASATLNGSATDDGLPSGSLTCTWSKVSGPGTVTFGSASLPQTTASFTVAGTYVLRLSATDGALSRNDDVTVVVAAPAVDLRDPENPSSVADGLDYEYYEGDWSALPDFDALVPVETGTVATVDLSIKKLDNLYAVRFRGFVLAPVDGLYTFYTNSDDGSRLYMGDELVVDNDGLHGMRERSGQIGLQAGLHAVTITFFERYGGDNLIVSWAGPGLTKEVLPASAFRREVDPVEPIVSSATIMVDFGDAAQQTSGWNNLSGGDATAGILEDLIDTESAATGIRLAVTDAFAAVNGNGTTSPDAVLGYPASATRDSFWGCDVTYSGKTEPTAGLTLSGLSQNARYSFTFFASRIGTSDNRETQYTVTGAFSETAILDAGLNTGRTAQVVSMQPAADGTITIDVRKGPNNTNSYGFYYLGVMQVDVESQTNEAPVIELVQASATEVTLPVASVALSASASDADGDSLTYQWAQTAGPASAVIQYAQTSMAQVTFAEAGSYEFCVEVSDGNASVTQTVTVVVHPAVVRKAKVDFGGASVTAGWNNLSGDTAAHTGVVADLLDDAGATTGIRLEVTDAFSGVNPNGTTTPATELNMPVSACSDSFWGCDVTYSGRNEPTAAVTLSGLNPQGSYVFSFFASRIGASDNRQTQYTVTGASTETLLLDAAGNHGTSITSAPVRPAADGTITINVCKGPENNNSYGFYYLGALQIEIR